MLGRLIASIGLLACCPAWAGTALQSGVGVSVPLNGSIPAPNYYIDVGASAQQLTVSIGGGTSDADLFLRYGSPFPEQDSTVSYPTTNWDLMDRYAQYHSVSSDPNESILVLPSSRFPLRAGRWYIAIIGSSSSADTTTLKATVANTLPVGNIVLDFLHPRTDSSDATNNCDDSFWTDTTPATPVGGNNGTTLGQQRKNALTYATQQLVQQLQIPVTINAHACGAHLGGDSNSAILAHAGPTSYIFDEPKFPINSLTKKYTWYPAAAIARRNGTMLCGAAGGPCDEASNAELEITFNEDVGQSTIIDGEKFYLGFDSAPGSDLDFITIAMHEMTHGLGFFGLANTDSTLGPLGAKAGINTQQNTVAYQNVDDGPYDDIYDDFVAEVDGTTYKPFMGYEVTGSGDAARAAALVSGPVVTSAGTYNPGIYTGLRWFDSAAANSSVNIHNAEPAPNDFPSLYAPCDKSKTTACATQPSSTLAHTVQAGDMMNAYYSRSNLRNMGLAVPMLGPIGWSNAAAPTPEIGTPMPSNWFDRTHSGHGFDFQLAYPDAEFGDVYILTFYTYEADGTPEWYQAYGHVVDGVFAPTLQANGGTMYRIRYDSNALGHLNAQADNTVIASVTLDFNQAANSPACRNADRSAVTDLLAVMTWVIGSENGAWCMEPLVTKSQHATPDYNGHWYSSADSGWGFELLDVANGSANPDVYAYVYYPGPNNQPTWAFAFGKLSNGGTGTLQLQQISNGYCRTCSMPPTQQTATIGTMSINLDPSTPSGVVSIQAAYPGGGSFSRNNISVQMLSYPNSP